MTGYYEQTTEAHGILVVERIVEEIEEDGEEFDFSCAGGECKVQFDIWADDEEEGEF